ncbi:MAG TPA: hypothetical protein VMF91_15085 [Bryobacteraceae bacterium]|nr:hypothetical protein [Bryobacteraceae bacterium]
MHFSYEGFTHNGNMRCFLFHGIQERDPISAFSIEVDLPLLLQNGIPVQEGPMFCLQLLTTASLAGPAALDRFHTYRVVGADLRPLLVEREKHAAEKALKARMRRPVRKPSHMSNLRLGIPTRLS